MVPSQRHGASESSAASNLKPFEAIQISAPSQPRHLKPSEPDSGISSLASEGSLPSQCPQLEIARIEKGARYFRPAQYEP
jgi:hypothetical protein